MASDHLPAESGADNASPPNTKSAGFDQRRELMLLCQRHRTNCATSPYFIGITPPPTPAT